MSASTFNAREIAQGRLTNRHRATLAEFHPGGTLESQIRAWQFAHGLVVDDCGGKDTQASLDAVIDDDILEHTPLGTLWTPWDGPATRQPRNMSEVVDMMGDPTRGGRYNETEKPDPKWVKANIIECHGANALHPSAVKSYKKVHRIVEPYLREALRRAEISAPGYIKVISGPLVFRHIRHDPKRALSNHSWGIAVDINPADNRGIPFKRGTCPRYGSAAWRELYPRGVPLKFVQAFASCGFAWGSDWDEDGRTDDETYCDPMHFEWIARDGRNVMV